MDRTYDRPNYWLLAGLSGIAIGLTVAIQSGAFDDIKIGNILTSDAANPYDDIPITPENCAEFLKRYQGNLRMIAAWEAALPTYDPEHHDEIRKKIADLRQDNVYLLEKIAECRAAEGTH